jgi:hypothetical protein
VYADDGDGKGGGDESEKFHDDMVSGVLVGSVRLVLGVLYSVERLDFVRGVFVEKNVAWLGFVLGIGSRSASVRAEGRVCSEGE